MSNAKPKSDMLNVREAAALLGVKPCTVRAFAKKGLPCTRLSARTIRFSKADIEEFIASLRTGA